MRRTIFLGNLVSSILCSCMSAQVMGEIARVTIAPDWKSSGIAIGDDFAGRSFETRILLPYGQGRRVFRGDNAPLVAMFKTLGVRNLRIGGGTRWIGPTCGCRGKRTRPVYAISAACWPRRSRTQ